MKIPESIKNNSIVEFKLTPSGEFEFKDVRTDKSQPNALNTVLNVINSFKNPVLIKDLFYFFNQSHKDALKIMLEEAARQSRPNRSSVVNTPCLSRSLVGVFVLDRCRSELLGLHHEKVQNGDYFKSER